MTDIVLRDYQMKAVNEIRAAFCAGHKSVLFQLSTGGGKCLGKGTPILLYDGRTKNVEDIKVGDQLIGPDSTPRNVLSICRGREPLYRVVPKKGDSYVVNESHILSLRMTRGMGSKFGNLYDNQIINMSVIDYLNATNTFRHCAKGWRSDLVNFKTADEPLLIDPYFLGLWLGDGDSRVPSICTGDEEINRYLCWYAATLGMHIWSQNNSENSVILHLKSLDHGPGRNPLTNALRRYGILKNKRIPPIYFRANARDRLELLAGILDTDGYWGGHGYDLILKSEELLDDVIFLARSLGFSAYKKAAQKRCCNNGVVGQYWRCCINGPVDVVPCKLPRKKAQPRKQKKNPLNVGIHLEPMGVGDYYGFEIDGDHLFLLGDFTVTHNTLTAGYMVGSAANLGNTSMFVCNRVELLDQTVRAFARLDIRAGIISAGYTPDFNAMVQIASIDTLKRRLSRIKTPRFVVWDECRGLGAKGWTAVYNTFPDAVHLGLDATPLRLDGKGLGNYFSHMVCGPTYSELMSVGALVPFKVFAPTTPDMSGVHTKMGEFDQGETEAVMDKPTITGDIVRHYCRLAQGKQGIAFAVSRKHSEHLAEQFCAAGVRAVHLDGETDKATRQRTVAAYRRRELDVLVNVNLFSAGFDVPGVEVIIDAAPTQSLAMYMQRAGRGSRPEPDINKKHCLLLDHSGNVFRHNLPDVDRQWTLEGADKKKRKKQQESSVPIRQCPRCFAVFPPAPVCPACGHVLPVQSREIEQVDGDLTELTPEMMAIIRERNKREVQRARTLDALMAIEKQRGYRSGWARAVFMSRQHSGDHRARAQYEAFMR